jgi:hypothetical protein
MLFYSYFKTLVGKEVSGALALGIGPPRAGGSSGWKTAVLPKQRMRPMLPMLLLALKLLHLRAADEVPARRAIPSAPEPRPAYAAVPRALSRHRTLRTPRTLPIRLTTHPHPTRSPSS